MIQLSRLNPGKVSLFTLPAFIGIARTLGRFHRVHHYESLLGIQRDITITDLHTISCRLPEYREVVRANPNITVRSTAQRLQWLGSSGTQIAHRDYADQPITEYWSSTLDLPVPFAPFAPAPITARCLNGLSPCRTMISLQSTTAHKSLSPRVARAVIDHVTGELDTVPTIIEGPGKPSIGIDQFGKVPQITIGSTEEFLQVTSDACCLLSVDNGLRHLASLAGIPRIVAYGPTKPEICGSGIGEYAIRASGRCVECGDPHRCAGPKALDCLNDIVHLPQEAVRAWSRIHHTHQLPQYCSLTV